MCPLQRLTPKKLERAKSLFFLIDVHFLFDNTVLQNLDENIIQFFAIDEFKCNNNHYQKIYRERFFSNQSHFNHPVILIRVFWVTKTS